MTLSRSAALRLIGAGAGAAVLGLPSRAPAASQPFGVLQRVSGTPVLAPRGTGFESAGVFNPSAVRTPDGVTLLYRAQDKAGTSRIGLATSTDGLHFTRRERPVLVPEAPYEFQGGVEDPRLVLIEGTYYLTYTGYDSVNQIAQLCMATSKDLVRWERVGPIMPANRGTWQVHWTKSGAIVPQKIGGRWWMYYLGDAPYDPPGQMGLAVSDDLIHWKDATQEPVLRTRARMFDSRVAEPGPAPLVTDEGILLIYNGADDGLVYSPGWALFDKTDPTKLLARAQTPVFAAYEPWERMGQVPNVVFVEGLVRDGDRLTFYYGAADTNVGAAVTTLRHGWLG